MTKQNTGRKEQHIKTASASLQRGKIKCLKTCFAWAVATLNAPLHHHEGHCKAYIASKYWKTERIALDKKPLNTSPKYTFPSLCQKTTGAGYPHSTVRSRRKRARDRSGNKATAEAQRPPKIQSQRQNWGQTMSVHAESPAKKWPTYLHIFKVHWRGRARGKTGDTHIPVIWL